MSIMVNSGMRDEQKVQLFAEILKDALEGEPAEVAVFEKPKGMFNI